MGIGPTPGRTWPGRRAEGTGQTGNRRAGRYYFPMTNPTNRTRDDMLDDLDTSDVQLTPAQAAELDQRLETLDEDIKDGRDAGDVLAELRRRYP
jgi:hypothetical protein